MDKTVALDISNLTKEYRLYNSEMDRLKETFNPFRKSYHRLFRALDGLNIRVNAGEKVGIIGVNGAGKSTLLKIITGVLNQTSGTITANGKIAALLELGAGFNSNYTGMENIRLNGTLSGLSESEIEQNIEEIAEFADIGDFINQPVKLYSSGMFVRLAFATQIFSNPDILIVDEALSVGDIRFQQKCYRAMDHLMKDKTVLLVTHDTAAVTRFCDRVIWLDHGTVRYDGYVDEGLKRYKGYLIDQTIEERKSVGGKDYEAMIAVPAETDEDKTIEDDNTGNMDGSDKPDGRSISVSKRVKGSVYEVPPLHPDIKTKGTGDAVIKACGLFDNDYHLIDTVFPEQEVRCVMDVSFNREIGRPLIGISVRDRLGNDVMALNSETIGCELPHTHDDMRYVIGFVMPELNQGQYTITVAVADGYQNDHIQLCWADDAIVFNIPRKEYEIPGTIYIEHGYIDCIRLD